jgi:hypothetical protein
MTTQELLNKMRISPIKFTRLGMGLMLLIVASEAAAQQDNTDAFIQELCINNVITLAIGDSNGGFNIRGGEASTSAPIVGRVNTGDEVNVYDVVEGQSIDNRTDWLNVGDVNGDGTNDYASGAVVWPETDSARILNYGSECKTTPEEILPATPQPYESSLESSVDTTDELVQITPDSEKTSPWAEIVSAEDLEKINEAIEVASNRASLALGVPVDKLARVDITNGLGGNNFNFSTIFASFNNVEGLTQVAWSIDQGSPNYLSYNSIFGDQTGVFNVPKNLLISAGFNNEGRVTLIVTSPNGEQVQLDTTIPIGPEDGDIGKLFVGDAELQKQMIEANKRIPFGIAIETSWENLDHLPQIVQDKYANAIYRNPFLKAIKAGEMAGSFVSPLSGEIMRVVDGQLQYYIVHPDMLTEQSWYTKVGSSQYLPGVNFYTQTLHPELNALFENKQTHTPEEIQTFITENQKVFDECKKIDLILLGEHNVNTRSYRRNERWYNGDFKGFGVTEMYNGNTIFDLEINVPPESQQDSCQIFLNILKDSIPFFNDNNQRFNRLVGVAFRYTYRQINERNNGMTAFTIPLDINNAFANTTEMGIGETILLDYLKRGIGQDFSDIPPFPF